ncbi:Hypothetical predicted protein [Cloeon dipterum]|uniref:Uncharacterized protein n=1 Tax=Cloeon dipterum TaxID=197152 RepID=A0A8S1DVT0_9INSE|nr:Hypothetical predicted protein [Cloeon dipterum]
MQTPSVGAMETRQRQKTCKNFLIIEGHRVELLGELSLMSRLMTFPVTLCANLNLHEFHQPIYCPLHNLATHEHSSTSVTRVGCRGEPSFLSKVAAEVCGDDFFRAQPAPAGRHHKERLSARRQKAASLSDAFQRPSEVSAELDLRAYCLYREKHQGTRSCCLPAFWRQWYRFLENLFERQGPRKPFPPRLKCGVVAPDEVINSYLAAPSAGNARPRPDASSTTPQFFCRQLRVASRQGADEGARMDVKDEKCLNLAIWQRCWRSTQWRSCSATSARRRRCRQEPQR